MYTVWVALRVGRRRLGTKHRRNKQRHVARISGFNEPDERATGKSDRRTARIRRTSRTSSEGARSAPIPLVILLVPQIAAKTFVAELSAHVVVVLALADFGAQLLSVEVAGKDRRDSTRLVKVVEK